MKKYLLQILRPYFIGIGTVKLFHSSRSLQTILSTPINEMPSLNQKKVTCDFWAPQTTKPNLARHKKRCSVRTLHCTYCSNFSTKSEIDLNYHFAKEQSAPKPNGTFKCKLC